MKTRSGGVVKPSRVSALVTDAIANVVKRLKAERLKAKKAADAERASERLKHLQKRDVVQLAALRRKDAEVVEKLLDMGQCAVRFKLHGACQMVRRDRVDRAKWLKRRESMKRTSWVLCKACDDEGRHAWRNPFQFYAPNELDTGHRHVPCCDAQRQASRAKGKPCAVQDLEPLRRQLADHRPDPPDANVCDKLARDGVAPHDPATRIRTHARAAGRVSAATARASPSRAEPPPEPHRATFPKCQRKLCRRAADARPRPHLRQRRLQGLGARLQPGGPAEARVAPEGAQPQERARHERRDLLQAHARPQPGAGGGALRRCSSASGSSTRVAAARTSPRRWGTSSWGFWMASRCPDPDAPTDGGPQPVANVPETNGSWTRQAWSRHWKSVLVW